eukprot:m.246786 g.246786  ORF g.246786 m.246786 type:complete len:492 (-) comp15179_c0_seq1:47-1522(-)
MCSYQRLLSDVGPRGSPHTSDEERLEETSFRQRAGDCSQDAHDTTLGEREDLRDLLDLGSEMHALVEGMRTPGKTTGSVVCLSCTPVDDDNYDDINGHNDSGITAADPTAATTADDTLLPVSALRILKDAWRESSSQWRESSSLHSILKIIFVFVILTIGTLSLMGFTVCNIGIFGADLSDGDNTARALTAIVTTLVVVFLFALSVLCCAKFFVQSRAKNKLAGPLNTVQQKTRWWLRMRFILAGLLLSGGNIWESVDDISSPMSDHTDVDLRWKVARGCLHIVFALFGLIPMLLAVYLIHSMLSTACKDLSYDRYRELHAAPRRSSSPNPSGCVHARPVHCLDIGADLLHIRSWTEHVNATLAATFYQQHVVWMVILTFLFGIVYTVLLLSSHSMATSGLLTFIITAILTAHILYDTIQLNHELDATRHKLLRDLGARLPNHAGVVQLYQELRTVKFGFALFGFYISTPALIALATSALVPAVKMITEIL